MSILDDDGPQTWLQLDSDAGDWVGQGAFERYTPVEGLFSRKGTRTLLAARFFGDDYRDMEVGAPKASSFSLGAYEAATQDQPRTRRARPDVYGDGRGCNVLSGRFFVLDLGYDAEGRIDRLAVNFEQHRERGAPALYGAARYHTTAGPSADLDEVPRQSCDDGSGPGRDLPVHRDEPRP